MMISVIFVILVVVCVAATVNGRGHHPSLKSLSSRQKQSLASTEQLLTPSKQLQNHPQEVLTPSLIGSADAVQSTSSRLIRLTVLFTLWYAFNAGCKLFSV